MSLPNPHLLLVVTIAMFVGVMALMEVSMTAFIIGLVLWMCWGIFLTELHARRRLAQRKPVEKSE